MAFGGVYPWAYGILLVLCGLFALSALAAGGWRVDTALTACASAVVVAVTIQLVPLAPVVLGAVSPASAAVLAQQHLGFAFNPDAGIGWHPLSVSPHATLWFLWYFMTLAAVFAGVMSLAATTPLRFVATSVTAIGAILALVGIVQAGTGSTRMYGLWAPLTHTTPFGPFVNRNHFAAWMLMALPLAMAQCAAYLAALRRDAGLHPRVFDFLGSPRAGQVLLTAFASLLMSVALLMTGSRAGIGGFVLIIVAMAWKQIRGRNVTRAAGPVAISALALAGLAVAWVGPRPILTRIQELPGTRWSGRLDAWSEAWRMAQDFWLTGSGLNTYATATLAYRDPNVLLTFATPHNDYLQAFCDGGLLVGVPLAALFGLLAVRITRASRSHRHGQSFSAWTQYGAAVGLGAVALQELVDFSLQTQANAVLFAVLAAYAVAEREDAPPKGHSPRRPASRSSGGSPRSDRVVVRP